MDIVGSELNEELAVIGEDEEFYEEIEAPKFVDFTVPDRSRPDDKSWFCLRIGCDQQHEEVDPDALFRSFKLRVLAARSPNIKLQKALNRQGPRSIKKCPQSAPAKSAKDRISRFSTMTSVPDKTAKTRLENHPVSTLRSTPAKTKASVQPSNDKKALTTPRAKNGPSNHEPFRSVKYHKAAVAPQKNRSVAKALFSTTPKNNCEAKVLNPDVCDGMRKLNLGSLRKHIPGGRFCSKSSRCVACDPNHPKSTEKCKKKSEGLSLQKVTREADTNSTLTISENSEKDLKEDNNVLIQAPVVDDDDNKENDSSSGNVNSNSTNSESESLQFEISDNIPQKEIRAPSKPIQESCAQARKVKRTTNPKPFRLRTDERGILKEANLEKKKLELEAQKESVPISKYGEGKQQNGKPTSEKSQQTNQDEGGQKDQPNRTRTPCAKLVRFVESRYANRISKCHKTEKKESEESQNMSVNLASSRKPLKTQSVKGERNVEASQFREKGTMSTQCQADKTTMAKGKRPTIPKDSNVHCFHVPKNRTMRPETIIT